MYNYESDARKQAEARYNEAMQRYASLMKVRNQMYLADRQKVADEEAAQRHKAEAATALNEKNWLNDASTGASMGASVGGPWGALVGGIVGTGYGMSKAYRQREKEGQSDWDAFRNTAFDDPFGASEKVGLSDDSALSFNAFNLQNGATAYGQSKAYNQAKADKYGGKTQAEYGALAGSKKSKNLSLRAPTPGVGSLSEAYVPKEENLNTNGPYGARDFTMYDERGNRYTGTGLYGSEGDYGYHNLYLGAREPGGG